MVVVGLMFVLAPLASAKDELSIRHGFVTHNIAKRWEHGLFCGNGYVGAVVMGEPINEKIIIDYEKLFLPTMYDRLVFPQMTKEDVSTMRQMFADGKYAEGSNFFHDRFITNGGLQFEGEGMQANNTLYYVNPFHPGFELLLNMDQGGEVRNYVRGLNFETGEGIVRFTDDRGDFERKLFVSRPDRVVVFLIKAPAQGQLNCELRIAPVRAKGWLSYPDYAYHTVQQRLTDGVKSIQVETQRDSATYRAVYAGDNGGYEGVAEVICKGGKSYTTGEWISVEGADEVLVLVKIDKLEDASESLIDDMQKDIQALPKDYDALLERHKKVHSKIFNRSKLDLGGGDGHKLTSNELVEKTRAGDVEPALVEKLYDYGRYLHMASMGDLPPNLQGVWTVFWDPSWNCSYTLNINAQLAVAPGMICNMGEYMEAYFKYIESMVPDWKENAQKYYGYRGVLACSHSGYHGKLLSRDAEWPFEFWTGGAAWLANPFYEYYQFTGDKDFLKNRAVPLMKEIAYFYEDFLTIFDDNGRYLFAPSYSPENSSPSIGHQACVNATMDIAAAKELLTNLIAACEDLGIEKKSVKKWKKMLTLFPDYLVNEDGALQEWNHPDIADNYNHRHVTHLYPAWPALEADGEPDTDVRLNEACRKVLQMHWEKGYGRIACHTISHMALAAARLKDKKIASLAADLWPKEWFSPENLIGSGWPRDGLMLVETNTGYTTFVAEALVFSRPGLTRLLSALPEKWSKGEITGILCRNQSEVESLKWDMDNKKITASLKSRIAQRLTLEVPGEIDSIKITEGQGGLEKSRSGDNYRILSLPAGKSVKLEIMLK